MPLPLITHESIIFSTKTKIFRNCKRNNLESRHHVSVVRANHDASVKNKRISDAAEHYLSKFQDRQSLSGDDFLSEIIHDFEIDDVTRNILEVEVQKEKENLRIFLSVLPDKQTRRVCF